MSTELESLMEKCARAEAACGVARKDADRFHADWLHMQCALQRAEVDVTRLTAERDEALVKVERLGAVAESHVRDNIKCGEELDSAVSLLEAWRDGEPWAPGATDTFLASHLSGTSDTNPRI